MNVLNWTGVTDLRAVNGLRAITGLRAVTGLRALAGLRAITGLRVFESGNPFPWLAFIQPGYNLLVII